MALGSTPAVAGAIARTRAIWRALLYTVGSASGGALLGYVVSLGGGLIAGRLFWLAFAGIIGTGSSVLAIRGSSWLPQRRWQVPKAWWARWKDAAYVLAGFTLTLGFLTPIYFASYYVLIALLAATEPNQALMAGVVYGTLRSGRSWRTALGEPTPGIRHPYRIGQHLLLFRSVVAISLGLVTIIAFSAVAVSLAT